MWVRARPFGAPIAEPLQNRVECGPTTHWSIIQSMRICRNYVARFPSYSRTIRPAMGVRRMLRFLCVCATAALPDTAFAQLVDQYNNNVNFTFSPVSQWTAQTFSTNAANVSGGGFLLINYRGGTWGDRSETDVTVNLWAGAPGELGSTKLAGGTAHVAADFYSYVWADVFWQPTAVVAGINYWLTIGGGTDAFWTNWSVGNEYSGGMLQGSQTPQSSEEGPYFEYGSGDAVFRTHTTVPEPSPYALTAAGLAALGVVARRRRRRLRAVVA